MKHKSKRWICTILTSVLVLTNADVSIYANETEEVIESTESTEVNETIEFPETTEMEQENTEIIDEDMQYEEVIEDTDATEKIETTENVTVLDDEKNGSVYELETLELDEDDDLNGVATESSDYMYAVREDGTISITGYDGGNGPEIEIPMYIDGYLVTRISDDAFQDNGGLTTITIPSSVTYIGVGAFGGCSSLRTITIPSSVNKIDDYAFYDCSELRTITIPSGVTYIGESTFEKCSELRTITIPSSVTYIAQNAFSRCDSLEEVTIPSSVTNIGETAFAECNSLEEIIIPSSVNTVGSGVFSNCKKLKKATILSNDLSVRGSIDSEGEYIIPIFSGCDALEEIVLSEDVTTIREGIFTGWNKLQEMVVPSKVTSIEAGTFKNCFELKKIVIPSDVAQIEGSAFSGCSNLSEIEIDGNNQTYVMYEGGVYDKKKEKLLRVLAGNSSIVLPNSIKIIGDYALNGLSGIERIEIPSNVEKIGESAFSGCAALNEIEIPKSVKEIGDKAFSGCVALKEAEIPRGVEEIGEDVFSKCPVTIYCVERSCAHGYAERNGLNYVLVGSDEDYNGRYLHWLKEDGTIEIDGYMLNDPESVTRFSLDIPATIGRNVVTSIDDYAFYGAWGLTSVKIPEGVKTIGEEAFAGCTALHKIVIPQSVTEIGSNAFENVGYLTIYGYTGSYAEGYAKEYGITFESIGEADKHTHYYTKKVTILATTSTDGERTYSCSCGNSYTEVIHKVSTVELKETVYTYDGKEKKPAVTVKDSKGNTLKKDEDYTLTYADECKEPGTYTVEITFKGSYYGTKALTYTIENSHVHSYTSKVTTAATTAQDGERTYSCSCGNSYTEVIHKVSTVALKETVYNYDGKEKKPAVTVKDSEGNTLETNKDYTLAYQNECKNPGQYVVTVNFKGNYEGTKKLIYTINPKSVSLSKVTAEKNGFKATWKKGDEISGYQIQYATDSNFSNKKTESKTISKSSTTSNTISKLKSQEKYYVRIRTFKTVNVDGKEQKLYSEWSEVKTVITENAKGKVSEVKTVKLSENSYVYNGKVRKPSVLVKDKKGNVLEKNKEYTVTYAKGCKNPGRYSVTIKFKGNYSGTKKKTLYFTIKPAKVSVSKVSAASKGFKAEWKKGTGVSGYEIQYSTSSKFTKKTTESKNISSGKTKSKRITKLSAKKKYYVRIRAYKTVKVDGKSVKLYSAWSKAKSVTTKK